MRHLNILMEISGDPGTAGLPTSDPEEARLRDQGKHYGSGRPFGLETVQT